MSCLYRLRREYVTLASWRWVRWMRSSGGRRATTPTPVSSAPSPSSSSADSQWFAKTIGGSDETLLAPVIDFPALPPLEGILFFFFGTTRDAGISTVVPLRGESSSWTRTFTGVRCSGGRAACSTLPLRRVARAHPQSFSLFPTIFPSADSLRTAVRTQTRVLVRDMVIFMPRPFVVLLFRWRLVGCWDRDGQQQNCNAGTSRDDETGHSSRPSWGPQPIPLKNRQRATRKLRKLVAK
mmetsp:Transcript_3289/g.8493  ORF Transcript_3289/g.8493 Transcript_3289/m.8493 type:complete len:238 (-) Transcript_3289:146-859(-)